MKKYLFLFLVVLSFSFCKKNDFFEKPQPEEIESLTEIPIAYRGVYLDADSDIMIINPKTILNKKEFKFGYSKTEIDTSHYYRIQDNILIDNRDHSSLPCVLKNDSIFIKRTVTDTTFNISDANVAKFYRGHLILNTKSTKLWLVNVYSLHNNYLKISVFTSIKSLNQLSENKINNEEISTVNPISKPTQKEFRNLILPQDSLVRRLYKKMKY